MSCIVRWSLLSSPQITTFRSSITPSDISPKTSNRLGPKRNLFNTRFTAYEWNQTHTHTRIHTGETSDKTVKNCFQTTFTESVVAVVRLKSIKATTKTRMDACVCVCSCTLRTFIRRPTGGLRLNHLNADVSVSRSTDAVEQCGEQWVAVGWQILPVATTAVLDREQLRVLRTSDEWEYLQRRGRRMLVEENGRWWWWVRSVCVFSEWWVSIFRWSC